MTDVADKFLTLIPEETPLYKLIKSLKGGQPKQVSFQWLEDDLVPMPDIVEAGNIRLRVCPNFIHCPHTGCCYHNPAHTMGTIIDCRVPIAPGAKFPERIQLVEINERETQEAP